MTVNPPDKSPDKIFGSKPLEPAATTPQAPAKDFRGSMETPSKPGGMTPQTVQGPPGPASVAPNASAPPSLASIQASARAMQDNLGTVAQQLKTKNLKLRRSQSHLLKNKLTEAQSYIRQAASKVGVESPPLNIPSGTSPVGRFLAYINDGQNQLIEVQQKLKEMSSKGQQLNAAEMLTVTVKMNLAQQEIEYSATLLSKVIESMKQLMNIQL